MIPKTYIALLLGVMTLIGGCAAPPGAGTAPLVPGAPGTTPPASGTGLNVAVPQHLDIDVYKHCSSIWDVLGIPEIARAFRNLGAGLFQLGARMFPSLATANPQNEPGAPLLPVNSPANMNSSSPAIQSAAKIKADEDQAAQKIKAINYLATIGCGGCYPGVEEAFLASLDDCTESVRYAAVNALKETAGNPCVYCSHKSCCSPKIRQKLMEMTMEGDCLECAGEPSARVRRVARIALFNCGCKDLNAVPDPISSDIEGPTKTSAIQTIPTTPAPGTRAALASHQQMTAAAETAPPVLNEADVQKLAAEWLADLDPELPLHEKRDLIRRKMRNYLQTQNEREILLGDLMHELQVQNQLQTVRVTPASASTPEPTAIPPEVAEVIQKAALPDFPLGHARAVIRQPLQSQGESGPPPFPTGTSNKSAGSTPPTASGVQLATGQYAAAEGDLVSNQQVRWESLYLRFSPDFPAEEAHQQMAALRKYLQMDSQSAPPSAEVRKQLKTATVTWTPTAAVEHSEKRQALETLPVGEISPILQIDGGLEIVRVLQRAPLDTARASANTP